MTSSYEQIATLLGRDYQLARDRLSLDVALVDLGIDSLNAVELLWTIEEELMITLPVKPVILRRLGDVVRFIDEIVAKQGVPARERERAAITSAAQRAGR